MIHLAPEPFRVLGLVHKFEDPFGLVVLFILWRQMRGRRKEKEWLLFFSFFSSDKKTRMDRIMGEELEMEERKGCDGCDWKWPL